MHTSHISPIFLFQMICVLLHIHSFNWSFQFSIPKRKTLVNQWEAFLYWWLHGTMYSGWQFCITYDSILHTIPLTFCASPPPSFTHIAWGQNENNSSSTLSLDQIQNCVLHTNLFFHPGSFYRASSFLHFIILPFPLSATLCFAKFASECKVWIDVGGREAQGI